MSHEGDDEAMEISDIAAHGLLYRLTGYHIVVDSNAIKKRADLNADK